MARIWKLLAVIAVSAVQFTFASSSYESEFDDWLYDIGRPSSQSGGRVKCKKDLLLVVDTSYSITRVSFRDDVKPFLKRLVTDPILNVGKGSTQVSLIIFSHEDRTKILLKFGDIYDAEELGAYMEGLEWNDVSGSRTRTDIGLKFANEIFSKENPDNNRPKVDDVVVIITDGRPSGKTSTQLSMQYANELKEKGVLVVGAAVGPKRQQFLHILEGLATSPKYVLEADFNQMDDILAKLVTTSCIKPGQCTCHKMKSSPIYIKPGHSKAVVEWPIPQFTCKAGPKATVKKTTVEPPLTSPHAFSIGEHVINYVFKLKGRVTVTCPVIIKVKVCQCPESETVTATLPSGESIASVSWTVPKPNCPAIMTSVSPPSARHGRGDYAIGEHSALYNYEYTAATGSFTLTCSVNISVKGQLCRGKAFNSREQACCCGTVHPRKPGYECCGPDYFNTNNQKCCENANLISIQDSCPNH